MLRGDALNVLLRSQRTSAENTAPLTWAPNSRRRPIPAQPDPSRFDIRLNDKYGHLTKVDIPKEASEHVPWFNQTLTTVNDSVVRLGIFDGEFHWHKHDNEDEFFLVLDGKLLLDVEGKGTFVLEKHEGLTVPRGVVHRPRSPGRSVVLMVESIGIVPTGDPSPEGNGG